MAFEIDFAGNVFGFAANRKGADFGERIGVMLLDLLARARDGNAVEQMKKRRRQSDRQGVGGARRRWQKRPFDERFCESLSVVFRLRMPRRFAESALRRRR